MRYQLRYIRAQRARSSPGAKHDDSPVSVPTQIPCSDRVAEDPRPAREHLGRPLHVAVVLVFDVVRLRRRSRGSVEERPLHTRKVAGSIPAGTTQVVAGESGYLAPPTKARVISRAIRTGLHAEGRPRAPPTIEASDTVSLASVVS